MMEEHTTPEAAGQPVQPDESATTPAGVGPSTPPFVDLSASVPSAPQPEPTPVIGTPPVTPPIGNPSTGLSTPPFVDLSGAAPPPLPPSAGSWVWVPPAPEPAPSAAHRSRRPLALLGAAVVLAAGLGTGLGLAFGSSTPATQPIPGATAQAPLSGNASVAAIAKAVDPAVVDIATTVASPGGSTGAEGTGMILTSSGEVLTNNHVVEDATSIHVTIQGRTGSYGATVLGVDPVHDVALLQVNGVSGLPTVSLGNSSSVKLGDSVVAIGNALGLGGAPSVTQGAISGINRSIQASDAAPGSQPENLTNLLETDAQIQPGDSGGPLVNSRGQVIGMDTAAASGDGSTSIGFAIPINQARTIAQDIQEGKAVNHIILGLSPFLGVDVEGANIAQQNGGFFGGNGFGFGSGFGFSGGNTGTAPTTAGQFVEAVVTSGPADKAGIVAGDTITSINGTKVTNNSTTLTNALAKLKAGSTVAIGIVNSQGTASTVNVQLGSIPK